MDLLPEPPQDPSADQHARKLPARPGNLDDVAGWGAMLAEALRATGGELSDTERAWADEVLGTGTQPAP